MSMTLEEAIEYFKMKVSAREAIGNDIGTDYEAYKIAISALHPVSRERVEEAWMGHWVKCKHADYYVCNKCSIVSKTGEDEFCKSCGAPMTDDAVDILLKKLEVLYENIHNG